jgi:hypothetical protein
MIAYRSMAVAQTEATPSTEATPAASTSTKLDKVKTVAETVKTDTSAASAAPA